MDWLVQINTPKKKKKKKKTRRRRRRRKKRSFQEITYFCLFNHGDCEAFSFL